MQEVLRKRMDAEVPRNHLDLRHRLDAQGNRYGKVIDYKYVGGASLLPVRGIGHAWLLQEGIRG